MKTREDEHHEAAINYNRALSTASSRCALGYWRN